MILFGRKVKLDIYSTNQLIEVTELYTQFSVDAHRRKSPNKAEIKVTNLPPSVRSILEEDGVYIEFFAGYASSLNRVFKGYVQTADSVLKDSNWTTTIVASDTGQDKAYTNAMISKTFASGTPVRTVFTHLAEALNMPILLDYKKDEVLLTSETYMGTVRSALNDIAQDYGFSWSIQYGVLEVIEKGKPPIKESKSMFIDRNLMVNPPEVTKKGVKLDIQIVPNLIPSRLITFDDYYDIKGGTFIIDSIKLDGDNGAGKYDAEVDAWRHYD